jgi:hypothetical protein
MYECESDGPLDELTAFAEHHEPMSRPVTPHHFFGWLDGGTIPCSRMYVAMLP